MTFSVTVARIPGFLALAIGMAGTLPAQMAPNEQSARAMQLERFVVPDFPPFLRQSGVLQGTVVAAIGREPSGRVVDVLVLESSDTRFASVTLEAINEWKFKPLAPTLSGEETSVPVVRFLFTTGAVSIVPLTMTNRSGPRRTVRAETPVELPNFSHLDHPPRLLKGTDPEFPAALRGRVANGTVVVKYFVDGDGRVRLPMAITATAPEFGAAAVAALRNWVYEPPRIDGKPVIALERHSFQFAAAP
jgi:TonB family protein